MGSEGSPASSSQGFLFLSLTRGVVILKSEAANHFVVEPTGGIDLENFREIMQIILDEGVEQVIPHVYSSIIDKESGDTRTGDVKKFLEIVKELV